MEKTERKTGGIAKFQEMSKDWENNPKILRKVIENMSEKIDELQAKAKAYDRIMSGGKKTLKEWANIFGMNMAVDEKGDGIVSKYPLEFRPLYDGYKVAGYWTIRAGYPYTMFNIPFYIIDFSGSWQDSLTLPDGWEE